MTTPHADSKLADLLVLALIGANVVLNPPYLRVFSAHFHLHPAFDGDVLSGLVTMLGVLLMAAYAWCAVDGRRERRGPRLAVVLASCALFVVLPTVADISSRAVQGIYANDRFVSFPHDGGVLQTEAAIRFLLAGQNPYAVDYSQTEMARSHHSSPAMWQAMGLRANPAFSFLPYPPLHVLASAPLYLAAMHTLGWYDQRLVYLVALFALGALVPFVTSNRRLQLVLLAFLLLCPWQTRYVVQGYNDVVCVLFLVATAAAMRGRRPAVAGLCLALACGAKQFAWFGIPLYLAWLGAEIAALPPAARAAAWARPLAVFGVVASLLFAPFFFWGPGAFLRSLVLAQGYEYPFRIQGLGLANLFVLLGWVREPMGALLLQSVLQMLILPVLGWGVWRILRGGGVPAFLRALAGAVFLFVFVSRHFAPNYLFLPTALFACALLMESETGGDRARE